MAMENGPFEDELPIENGDVPAGYVSLPEGIFHKTSSDVYSSLCYIENTLTFVEMLLLEEYSKKMLKVFVFLCLFTSIKEKTTA